MADSKLSTEQKCANFEQIKQDIDQENLLELSKDRLQECCKELKLKVTGEKKELVERLAPLGKSSELFAKKVKLINAKYSFKTSLNPLEIPAPSAKWKVLGRDQHINIPKVDDNTIREYKKNKYAGMKGQYRKAYRMFSSRRIVSVKVLGEESSSSLYIKANILKSFTGSQSRPVTMLFSDSTPLKAYCICAVGKCGVCCHALALLLQLKYFTEHKKLHLHMTCTEKLQVWHRKRATTGAKGAATQIKLKYLRNLRGARADMKKVRKKRKVNTPNEGSDYSDWYRREVFDMEAKVKAKLKTMSKSPECHFFSTLCKYKKKSGLFLHLQYKLEYEKREAGKEYNNEILKPRFTNKTESVWRPKSNVLSKDTSSSSSNADGVESQPMRTTSQEVPLLQRNNYVPVDQCSENWRAIRIGVITASKAPALLGLHGLKEFDNAWFAIKNKIDESKLNPKRAKLPNFIRGKQEEKNAINQFSNDSSFETVQCGYFRHPSDDRFGASPDGIINGQEQSLIEIKTRSLPNKKQLEKMNEEERNVKLEALQTPLQQVRKEMLQFLMCSVI